jgi:hypothetical protein
LTIHHKAAGSLKNEREKERKKEKEIPYSRRLMSLESCVTLM